MQKKILSLIAIGIGVWEILYVSGLVLVEVGIHRGIFLCAVLLIILLSKPLELKIKPLGIILDLALILMALSSLGYYVIFYKEMMFRAGLVYWYDILFTGFATVVLLETIRRTVGMVLSGIVLFFIVQAYYSEYFPGFLHGQGYSMERISTVLFLGNSGIFGLPLDVAATFIFVFVMFGAFFSRSGVGQAFLDLAYALFGGVRGGPAKVSIFASGLMGSVSGSAAANVVTTGVFTIPMMKRVGYTPVFAGAVEAVASTGGMIMPPIMAAAGFLMAQFLGIPYSQVMLMALLPALFYYIALFIAIDSEAGRRNIKGVPRSELPNIKEILKKSWYLFIPLILLVYLLVGPGWSPTLSGLISIVAAIVVSWFTKENKIGFKEALGALEDASKGITTVAVACAGAGIVVGLFGLTGLGVSLSSALIDFSGGNLYLLLLLVAVAGLILGMGLTATAIYITLVVLLAPAIVEFGLPAEVAHMFVFYYGVLSSITPPVAIAAYAAAGLIGESPMKVAVTAAKLGFPLYLLPFTFGLNPAFLMMGTWQDITQAVCTGLIAVYALSTSLAGYAIMKLNWMHRVILFSGGVLLLIPEGVTDMIGLLIIIPTMIYLFFASRKVISTASESKAV
jgi:TRAP transporter 4TM/12TM fusion protein